jgi:predicted GNAT superfamily acetyltransferase
MSALVPLDPASLDDALALNQACVPEVGTLDAPALKRLVELACVAVAARDEEGLLGFLLALDPHTDYQSPNYRWFCARGSDFVYVDRIAVAPRARGKGVGRSLYDEVFRVARGRQAREVTCEVNLLPPNPTSLAFHQALGFRRVGELVHVPGEKAVAMLSRALTG